MLPPDFPEGGEQELPRPHSLCGRTRTPCPASDMTKGQEQTSPRLWIKDIQRYHALLMRMTTKRQGGEVLWQGIQA